MDKERTKFIAKMIDPHTNKSEVCREFGISRQVGYKILNRFKQEGIEGIKLKSRAPKTIPNAISSEIICEIVNEKGKHPTWGGKKIHTILLRKLKKTEVPSIRSIERILNKCGMTAKRKVRTIRYFPNKSDLIQANKPNEVWTTDFKGEWKMKNGEYCYPLTIRDEFSKYIIGIFILPGTRYDLSKRYFEICFKRYGLPNYIRSDNGSPFASVRALKGLTKLSAWWIKNGVFPNRIPPASPYLNGGHERMHLDMSKELECNPLYDLEEEQKRSDKWHKEYNEKRPHEALNNKCPADIYRKSKRKYQGKELFFKYSPEYELRKIDRGNISWLGKKIFLTQSLNGETVGIKKEQYGLSLWYCEFKLGDTDPNFETSLKAND